MKQTLLLLAAVAAFIVILGVLTKYPQETGKALSDPGSYASKTIQTTVGDKKLIKVGKHELLVEIADDENERAKGLSGRKSLPEQEGMFFVFPKKDFKPSFWMKGMLMAIDIIWINDNKIAQINTDVQPPVEGTPDRELPLLIPDGLVDYVLEVAAGFSEKKELKVGTPIDLSNIEG
jgi:uncharacterized membrane protein (UPF0127 family)